jgi:ABC-type transporter Mla subunit MlaD
MEMSRKRRRELKRLRGNASDLGEDQREVLDRATKVLSEARRQLVSVGREEVAPRVRDTTMNKVIPAVATSVVTTKRAARSAREKLSDEIFPAVTGAFGSAMTLAELAKDARVRDAIDRVRKGKVMQQQQKSSGPGRFILMTVGMVALAGVAYAAWQTLRSDDDLWVGDEADGFDEPTPTPSAPSAA